MAATVPLGTIVPAWASVTAATATLAVLVIGQRINRRSRQL
jgi:hypothetical protein